MIKKTVALALSVSLFTTSASAQQELPQPPADSSQVAWDIVSDLTTEIGPRLAGSPREAAARDWAVERLTRLGFTNVRIEPFTLDGWVRGEETARLTAPYPQTLAITALGTSASTGAKGISGELVYFPTLAALRAAPASAVRGKIAFIDHAMRASQDGSGYGPFGDARRSGPAVAAEKGAIATVIRSAGTDNHRNPHTGATNFTAPGKAVPAGAVSNPDADLIARIAAKALPMHLALKLTGHPVGKLSSGNVVADLPGRDPTLAPILVACHLDSWDLATGAIDDGAGCAIVAAAALAAQNGGAPLRTIRVLWAGSEEPGGVGGDAYAAAHKGQPHALVMESDTGADKVWRVSFDLTEANGPLADRIVEALAPFGIVRGTSKANGGTDVEPIAKAARSGVIGLNQDMTRYFDIHHSPDDTLDKVDRDGLAQNVAVWTTVLRIVANEPGSIAGM